MDGTATRSRGRFSISQIINYFFIALQFIAALAVLIAVGARFHQVAFSTAVYVILLAVITIITSAALFFLTWRPSTSRMIILGSLVWQVIMVLLWAAAAGALGTRGNTRSTGIRAAMALSLIEMLTFLASSLIVSFGLWRGRGTTTDLKHGV